VVGLVAALAVAYGVVRRRPDVLDK
jgi:hypothetical protein